MKIGCFIGIKGLIFLLSFFLVVLSLHGPVYGIPPVHRVVLPNGLTVLICEEHSLPVITIKMQIDAGSVNDPVGFEGTSYITGRTLLGGTKRRSAIDIANEIDFIGASIDIHPGKDTTSLSLKVLKKDLKKGFDIFMDILTEATFPVDEIEKSIENGMGLLESIEENPGDVAAREFQKLLYTNTRYGHPVEGTKESLTRIKREQVLDFYRRYYRAENAIFVIVGDISRQEVMEEIVPLLEKVNDKKIDEKPQKIKYNENPSTLVIDRNLSQTNIILGHAGITRDNPDFYAISVLNQIFGSGGFASRLMEEIRNKRGLAYSVYGYFDADKHTGSFQIVMQTKNESAKKA
ncbi:MAG: insulinase family protein, partial [Syntrophorhabdaceae bacterium]|nr:insulinase family protein [Syntrophorhabdaceae bacterium]